jgi:cytoskeleton protein RodZ
MATLGADLQHARELAGLSLDDLSAKTKIRKTLLEAIERDDYRSVPGGLLARGYLRAYAKEVGLSAEPVATRYQTEFAAAQPAEPQKRRTDADVLTRPARSHGSTVVVALLAVAAVWLFAGRREPQRDAAPPAVGTTGQTVPVERATDRPASADAATAPAAAAVSVVPLTLDIVPTRVVWIKADADGKRVLYALVGPDQPRAIHAREEIVLRIGDAGAFRYRVNGVEGRELGAAGEVRDLRITPQNARTFQVR